MAEDFDFDDPFEDFGQEKGEQVDGGVSREGASGHERMSEKTGDRGTERGGKVGILGFNIFIERLELQCVSVWTSMIV